MNASEKVVQSLQQARAAEDALVRVLQSQIAMTPSGAYRSALETHLRETRHHSELLSDRIGVITGGQNPLQLLTGLAESLVGQSLALAKTPLDLMRGSGGEEKVLANARDAAASEAFEIATYISLERLAVSVGDDETAELARDIRDDEERMLDRVLHAIPTLTDAVVAAQLRDDPSYDATRTGAADAVREVADDVSAAAEDAQDAVRRTARQARKVPGVARAEGQVKGAVADASDLAIARYDALTVDEINAKLPGLSQIELARIDSYERRHDDRTTVLGRIETLRGEEPWPGYDELTANEIGSVLAKGDRDRAREVRRYEPAHKNRSGVLKAAERRLADHERDQSARG